MSFRNLEHVAATFNFKFIKFVEGIFIAFQEINPNEILFQKKIYSK